MNLAVYASDPHQSRGRRHLEPVAPTRTEFQRDRDRIVHSSAFRRLVYKTQVFLNHEGDMFRTRLTHSLEVAQLGRSIARSLQLNEDLVEGISLAHDLGHTPFGHAGQDALHECMLADGGFEHNLQSLRVVDHLEQRYPLFDGLNLTFETREGILKHCSRANAEYLESLEPVYADGQGGVGQRFRQQTQPSLEAQLCNVADEIAYNAHDIDDGVRSGLISLAQMREVALFENYCEQALQEHPHLSAQDQARRLLYEVIRRMLSAQVYDVIASTQAAIQDLKPRDVTDIRRAPGMVRFSAPMKSSSAALKTFLFRDLYRHPQVVQTMDLAKQVVRELFAAYRDSPHEMRTLIQPGGDVDKLRGAGTHQPARAVADFIAGMTDRYAASEHQRLTGKRLLP